MLLCLYTCLHLGGRSCAWSCCTHSSSVVSWPSAGVTGWLDLVFLITEQPHWVLWSDALRVLKSSKRKQAPMHRDRSSLWWHRLCSWSIGQSQSDDQARFYVGGAAKAMGAKGATLLTFTGFHFLFVTPFVHPLDRCYDHLLTIS